MGQRGMVEGEEKEYGSMAGQACEDQCPLE